MSRRLGGTLAPARRCARHRLGMGGGAGSRHLALRSAAHLAEHGEGGDRFQRPHVLSARSCCPRARGSPRSRTTRESVVSVACRTAPRIRRPRRDGAACGSRHRLRRSEWRSQESLLRASSMHRVPLRTSAVLASPHGRRLLQAPTAFSIAKTARFLSLAIGRETLSAASRGGKAAPQRERSTAQSLAMDGGRARQTRRDSRECRSSLPRRR